MRRQETVVHVRPLFVLLGAAVGLLWSWSASAQTCQDVKWTPGIKPGERVYTCRSQFSTSRTAAGQSTWDDGAAIQDALSHPFIPEPGCDRNDGNGVRIVTILPGPTGSHRGACVVRAPIVLPSHIWLRGLRPGDAGAPTILKVDYNSTAIQPGPGPNGTLGGAFGLRVLTTGVQQENQPPNFDISVTDLEVDGSSTPIMKMTNPSGASVCSASGCEHADGIFLTSVVGGTVRAVNVHDILGDGIYVHANSANLSILDSRIYRAQRVGINFDGLKQSVIAGNQIWSVGIGLGTEDHTGQVHDVVVAHNAVLAGPVAGDDRLDPPPVAGDPAPPLTGRGIQLQGIPGNSLYSKTIIAKNRFDLGKGAEGVLVFEYSDAIITENLLDSGSRSIGDGGTGVFLKRTSARVIVSNNVIQGVQEPTPVPFCTLPGAASEQSNAAIELGEAATSVIARANMVHDAAIGLRGTAYDAAQADRFSFIDNIATGKVPAANSSPASSLIHWGVEMQGGIRGLISDNIISGYDRQFELTYGSAAQLSLVGNILGGGAIGRPIPGATTGNASESAGVTFDEANGQELKPFAILGNLAAPASGGSTFLPVRHTTSDINAGYKLGAGELELGRNIGLDATTYVYWSPYELVTACPRTEHTRAQNPLKTISPGVTSVGQATISGSSSQVSIAFARPLASATYRVVAQVTGKTGSPPAGATRVASIVSKTKTGFILAAEAAPGWGRSATFEWMVFP